MLKGQAGGRLSAVPDQIRCICLGIIAAQSRAKQKLPAEPRGERLAEENKGPDYSACPAALPACPVLSCSALPDLLDELN
ncbi:hypothetical protein A4R35_20330 [Thermogemmatispora tikiterensis]|uniref:Uncharacterized protein n=1 Tax=Thermogemmatispora tikiterensis TaxID=1825093 RepID=A0A328VKC3_9CHLR|nr:hypothetical protein A4R35_20330 [Thermogemmatispora tikiterensis]